MRGASDRSLLSSQLSSGLGEQGALLDVRFTRTRYPLHRLRFTLTPPPLSSVLNLFPTTVLSIALVWGRSGGGGGQQEEECVRRTNWERFQ